uniref:Uncharacterized protein n=1 Tax=Opuntia streptacantha TaxID=393608 RepID=A0A7C9CLW8_OPUST
MKKLIPMAAMRIRRVAGVGLHSNSFHTPWPCQLLDPWSSHARVISPRRSSASSSLSEVLTKTLLASLSLLFITSHLGDSGITTTPIAIPTAGTAARSSITLQFQSLPIPESA